MTLEGNTGGIVGIRRGIYHRRDLMHQMAGMDIELPDTVGMECEFPAFDRLLPLG